METEIEIERRNRIRVSLWAYAYELGDVELATDNQFDTLCRLIRPEIKTGRLDDFFATQFHPATGQWIHDHPELDGIKRIYERLTKETKMTTEQTVPLTDVLALMHKTGEIFQEFARVVSVAAPGVATMSLESAVAGERAPGVATPTVAGAAQYQPSIPAAPAEKKTRARKPKATAGGVTEEHEVAAVYNAVKAPAAPPAPEVFDPTQVPSFIKVTPPVPVAPPAPPAPPAPAAVFPPEGWQQHPNNPEYYHNGVEVITEAQLRARTELPAAPTSGSPYSFAQDISLEDMVRLVRKMCEDATKKNPAFSSTELQKFMSSFNGTGVTTLQEMWVEGLAYQFLSELEKLVLAA